MRRFSWPARWAVLATVLVIIAPARAEEHKLPPGIWVRPGYELTIAQDSITAPRFLCLDDDGALYVSLPTSGEIRVCRDKNNDGYFETLETFIRNHKTVHGMAWHDGWLWFTESGAIFKARDEDKNGRADEEVVVIAKGKLPEGGGHWWRSILIHKDRLYTSIGDSGNITDESKTPRQKIWSYKLDGSDEKLFCSGLRNTEKLVVRPGTDEIWGMDHGSDWFGGMMEKRAGGKDQPITDLNPPCEMNKYEPNQFYGHPFVVGNRVVRYEFTDRKDIVELAKKTVAPMWSCGAHWAPNAMCFYDADQFPDMKGNAIVAYHGSWNSSVKVGYCVSAVYFEDGKPWGEKVLVKFLTKEGEVKARPVDVIVAGDGSVLISDDEGNRIYRLRYVGEKK